MAARGNHHKLRLEERPDRFLRWLPRCSCGWTGAFARHRQADAEKIYRDHQRERRRRKRGAHPRPLTPLEDLPVELRREATPDQIEGRSAVAF